MIKLLRESWHTWIAPGSSGRFRVLDLGANKGGFAACLSSMGYDVVAVEPNPTLAARLAADKRFRVVHAAAVGKSGPVVLHIGEEDDASTLRAAGAERSLGSITVPGLSLAEILALTGFEEVDLLKMDIEGAEVDVIDSTPDHVFDRILQISVEFHDFNGMVSRSWIRGCRRRLGRLGFDSYRFTLRDHSDVLFVRSHRLGVDPFSSARLRLLPWWSATHRRLSRLWRPWRPTRRIA